MLDYKLIVIMIFATIATVLIVKNTQNQKHISELENTVDYLAVSENEIIIVVNENFKSKQDRTRIKIEDIITENHYKPMPNNQVENLARIIVKYSERYSIPVNLILAIITAESAFNRHAVSCVGALGLMQVMPSTAVEIAHELKVHSFDPYALDDGVRFGTYYLRKMLKTFNGDMELAVRAYNAGAENISKNIYPKETIGYHKSVMSVYRWLETRGTQCATFD